MTPLRLASAVCAATMHQRLCGIVAVFGTQLQKEVALVLFWDYIWDYSLADRHSTIVEVAGAEKPDMQEEAAL